jgi:hypothetical protein
MHRKKHQSSVGVVDDLYFPHKDLSSGFLFCFHSAGDGTQGLTPAISLVFKLSLVSVPGSEKKKIKKENRMGN